MIQGMLLNFGLTLVPVQVLLGRSIYYMRTWTPSEVR